MTRFCVLFTLSAAIAAAQVATFSIVAYDPANAEWGVTVASRYFSVGSVVPWAEADVGAIATQANVNVGYGPRGLELLRQGRSAKQALDQLLAEDKFAGKDGRQVAIVDARGNVAAYTGPSAPTWAGDRQGKTWSAQGNILVGPQVVESMGHAFEATDGELAEKLYAALKAGDDTGGDARGKQSASMLVVRKQGGRNINNDRAIYINVDDNPQPLPELRRLLDLNLGYLYQDRTAKLLDSGNARQARGAAAQVVRYWHNRPDGHLTLGLLNYAAGDKAAALAELRAARSLATAQTFRAQLENAAQRPLFQPVLKDSGFLKQLFLE
ncbi:MAG TPA: DUF1028 domain-containing protein [Bryobacteraceae bacterium]|nr:DUF1028 domain-containing protein [Bryobacteraceae bacterium]